MPGFTVIVATAIFALACFYLGITIGFKLGARWGIDEMKRTLDSHVCACVPKAGADAVRTDSRGMIGQTGNRPGGSVADSYKRRP